MYSQDLQSIVKSCLQVNAILRPNCSDLLNKTQLTRNKPEKLVSPNDNMSETELINTIRVPRNLGQITERLPAANYQSSSLDRGMGLPPTIN